MPHHEENNFSAPAEVVDFSALLFDMDGTIIDSTPAIVKYWQETGRQIGVDGDGELRIFSVLNLHAGTSIPDVMLLWTLRVPGKDISDANMPAR
jgi:phosphoglycolate phosphatase-like HAD superfamily hydrolase